MGNEMRSATKKDLCGTRFALPQPHNKLMKKKELKEKLKKKVEVDPRELEVATPSTSRNPPYVDIPKRAPPRPRPPPPIPQPLYNCSIVLEGVPIPPGSLIPDKYKTVKFFAAKEKFLRDFAYCEMVTRYSQKGGLRDAGTLYQLIEESALGFVPDEEYLNYVYKRAGRQREEQSSAS